MANLLDRIIAQLDSLVPYLSLAHTEVFDLVSAEYDSWCDNGDNGVPFPNSFDAFRSQVAHSAFVLGYSYADAFLADLMREIYAKHPRLLPKKKQLTFESIVDANDYQTVIDQMIENEVYDAMHGSIPDIQKYYNDKFSIAWLPAEAEKLATASLVRNCIIHNNSIVGVKLAEKPNWNLGDQIALSVSDVHNYGIAIRATVRHLYGEAELRHLNRIAT